MGDFYAEKLVKKKTTGKDILIKCLMAALTVIAVFSFFVMPFGIFVVFLILQKASSENQRSGFPPTYIGYRSLLSL